MKNSVNLVFVALLLVVLGCSCPNALKNLNLDNKGTTPTTPNSTPYIANTANSPTTKSKAVLSMASYNQIKNGMKYSEAVKILGGEGAEVSTSEIGKYKTATYKWDGENYSYIILTFQNDKLMFKSQANLK
ncbi:MAG: DUF3862 domain-containing protein [Pyrinomonadaceae bacterium]|nr:DUF3862 domain-containing protein [Pyrinomonadaceae bacterium]